MARKGDFLEEEAFEQRLFPGFLLSGTALKAPPPNKQASQSFFPDFKRLPVVQ